MPTATSSMTRLMALIAATLTASARAARANESDYPYNKGAGKSSPTGVKRRDGFGNASGTRFDLGKDGAFKGQKIVVVQFHHSDFSGPKAALEKKGFEV